MASLSEDFYAILHSLFTAAAHRGSFSLIPVARQWEGDIFMKTDAGWLV